MSVNVHGTNGLTFNDNTTQATSPFAGGLGFRNRIINGDMRIDQRNNGASVTPTNAQYTLDRWGIVAIQSSKFTIQQNAGSVTPPAGFSNYLGVTSSSAYSVLSGDTFAVVQSVEGFNGSDLSWGTTNAQTITLSFWVRSSLTGVFGGSLWNASRGYVFTYSISAANTWEYKTVTIPGDTSGTYNSTNGLFTQIRFGLGSGSTFSGAAGSWGSSNIVQPTGAQSVVGTNGATFYITGVQLEKGSTATSFDYRPYGTELALCQRYYYRWIPTTSSSCVGVGEANSATLSYIPTSFPIHMRSVPSSLEQSGTASDYRVSSGGTTRVCSAVPAYVDATTNTALSVFTVASGQTSGNAARHAANSGLSGYLAWSAEL